MVTLQMIQEAQESLKGIARKTMPFRDSWAS